MNMTANIVNKFKRAREERVERKFRVQKLRQQLRRQIINKNKCSSRAFCSPFLHFVLCSHLKAFNFNLIMNIPLLFAQVRFEDDVEHSLFFTCFLLLNNFHQPLKYVNIIFEFASLENFPRDGNIISYISALKFNGSLCSFSSHLKRIK